MYPEWAAEVRRNIVEADERAREVCGGKSLGLPKRRDNPQTGSSGSEIIFQDETEKRCSYCFCLLNEYTPGCDTCKRRDKAHRLHENKIKGIRKRPEYVHWSEEEDKIVLEVMPDNIRKWNLLPHRTYNACVSRKKLLKQKMGDNG